MLGDIEINLTKGFTYCIVAEIAANPALEQNKVIYELAYKKDKCPVLTLQLNHQDFMELVVTCPNGTKIKSPPISPNLFAAYYYRRKVQKLERKVSVIMRLTPIVNDEYQIDIFINNRNYSSRKITVKMSFDTNLVQSVGANVLGHNQAQFSVLEMATYNRALDESELEEMNQSTWYKHEVGQDSSKTIELIQYLTKKSRNLLVEDKYDQIYKVAWLKLNSIEFNSRNLDEKFYENSDFNIIGLNGAQRVAGFLRAQNPVIYDNKTYIGLFDFDHEGTQQFHNLKNDKFWSKKTLALNLLDYTNLAMIRIVTVCFYQSLIV